MKTIIFLFSLISALSLSGQQTIEKDYYSHLVEVNKEWKNHIGDCPKQQISFKSDLDRIQAHLFLVCNSLTEQTPVTLNENQRIIRLELIAELRNYAKKKVFPTNSYHSIRTPYFVDDENVHCAVGYLMDFSGSKNLVAQIRKDCNYSYIEDIKTEGVTEWAFNHGFTVNELKWIQPGYAPADNIDPLSNGANGTVKKVLYDGYNGRIIIAGEFDSLDLLPCLNIGQYKDNQLTCIGNGITGIINEIRYYQNKIYAFGALESGGITYPLALFDGVNWDYFEIPSRENAIASTGLIDGSGQYPIEIAISHSSIPNKQEIWRFSNLAVWEKKIEVNGLVAAMTLIGGGSVFAGHFDEVFCFDEFGAIDSTFTTNNVVIRNNYYDQWSGINQLEISDTVKTIINTYSGIYFGGTCSFTDGEVCITRLLNDILQPIVLRSNLDNTYPVSINSLSLDYGSLDIIVGGKFELAINIGTYGKNFAKYNLGNNSLHSLGFLNHPVNSVVWAQNAIYLGGEFTNNVGITELNHLGKIDYTLEIDEDINQQNEITISPNPFISSIKINMLKSPASCKLIDINGKEIYTGIIQNNTISNLEKLNKGVYFLKVIEEDRVTTHRLVKQ